MLASNIFYCKMSPLKLIIYVDNLGQMLVFENKDREKEKNDFGETYYDAKQYVQH